MKTILFFQATATLATASIRGVGRSVVNLASIATIILLTILATSCNRPVDPIKPPDSETSTPPGTSTTTQPGSSTTKQPDGPIGVFKTVKISWAPTDFQEIQYDATDNPIQYTSQALYNQGTGQVQRFVYQFLYNSDQHLTRLNVLGGDYVQYSYEGNQISRAEEYSSAGERLKVHRYRYADTGQLIQIDTENSINGTPETRVTLQYDARGNLTLRSELVKNGQGMYVLETTTSFENYDNQKHVENLLTTFPYLPGVRFRVNNYRTKVVRYKDGSEIDRENFAYTYTEQGYPTQKVRSGSGGTLTATYAY